MDCCNTGATDEQFDRALAGRELRRFRRNGPDAPTRQLIAAAQALPLPERPTLLDIGGGVGTIHHVLLDQGFAAATHVDASAAYLDAAREESQRLGHGTRVRFQRGSFTTVAPGVEPADVVTLNRVVCCDPDYAGMLGAAAARARHRLAFSYPRPRPIIRWAVALANAIRRMRGKEFRAFVHPPSKMTKVLEQNGLRRIWEGGTWIWAIDVFERTDG
jgi:magnesium-protoporphyrin O-methyltransferase